MFAYIGCRTTARRNARGQGISVFSISPDFKYWERVQLFAGLENPSYLILNRQQDRLYCIHGDRSEISAFAINPDNGKIAFLNQVSTGGANPVHLALDPSERFILVSNHISSSVAVIALDDNGRLLKRTQVVELSGTLGPHRVEQPFAKPHANPFAPDGRVVVPDKGLDCLFVFDFDAVSGQLDEAQVLRVPVREGAGPRHIDFHPTLPYAYCVNELDSTVTRYEIDAQGQYLPRQIERSVSNHFVADNRAAGIAVNATGTELAVSNRGEDSIALFDLAPGSGVMTRKSSLKTEGKTPRFFVYDQALGLIHVANEDSDTLCSFKPEAGNDSHYELVSRVNTPSPVCIAFRYDVNP